MQHLQHHFNPRSSPPRRTRHNLLSDYVSDDAFDLLDLDELDSRHAPHPATAQNLQATYDNGEANAAIANVILYVYH